MIREIQLKPTEAEYKVATVVAADRLKVEAANAFLKTLEEPPPKSIFILLSTDPQRILETILSRCLRLNFAGPGPRRPDTEQLAWLTDFSEMAAADQKSLLGKYRLTDVLLRKLNHVREVIEKALTERSPLQRYPDAEKEWQEKWENELKAATTVPHSFPEPTRSSRPRSPPPCRSAAREPKMAGVQEMPSETVTELLSFPELTGGRRVAQRLSPAEAMENLQVMEQLQRQLSTNVQEALALEVGLLKLHM